MRSGQARARHVSVLYPSASFRVRVLRPPCSRGLCFKGWRMGVFGTHALGPATSPSCTRQQEACGPATRQASPSRPSRQRAELLHNARADTSPRIRHQTRPSPSFSVGARFGSGVMLFVGIPPPPRWRQVLLQPAGVAAARAVARRHGTPRDRQAPLGRSWQSSCASPPAWLHGVDFLH